MKKFLSIFISLILVLGIFLVLWNQKIIPVKTNTATPIVPQYNTNTQGTPVFSSTPNVSDTSPSPNVTVKDGVQYITIDVKNGYSPKTTNAKWGMPTKIIAKTNGSYGCETSLVIRSVKYQAYLPATADTEIDLGTPKSGETTDGVCGMGMYSFEVKYT